MQWRFWRAKIALHKNQKKSFAEIIELKKRGVFASALIKKRQYWPKYVAGDKIDKHFEDKEIGHVDSLPGKMHDVPFHIIGMKEPDYFMKLMST